MKIRAFCKAPASAAVLKTLPMMSKTSPRAVYGTNTEFLIRLSLEGRRILDRNDFYVKQPAFTHADLDAINEGYEIMANLCCGEYVSLSEGQQQILKRTLKSVQNLTSFYRSELEAIKDEIDGEELERRRILKQFLQACYAGDYKTIAKMYPYHDEALDLERKPDMQDLPSGVSSIPQELYEREKVESLKKIFGGATTLIPFLVTQGFGHLPDEIDNIDFKVSALEEKARRKTNTYDNARQFTVNFRIVLSDMPPPPELKSIQ